MALSAARNTPRRATDGAGQAPRNYPVNGTSVLYQGGIGCLNTEGNAVPGAATAGLICCGRIEATVDATNAADAELKVDIRPGVFRFKNSAAGDAITKAEIGEMCWIVDDETVAKTSNAEARPLAGIIVDVDADGVWVDMKPENSPLGLLALETTVVA